MAALLAERRMFGDDGIGILKIGVSLASLWAGAKGDYAKADKFYQTNLPRLRAEQKKGTLPSSKVTFPERFDSV